MTKSRLPFAKLAGIAVALVIAGLCAGPGAAQTPLDPTGHPKFVNPLPIPARIDASQVKGNYTMDMREVTQWLGLYAPDNTPLMTTVWGYGLKNETATYPGPTFVAHRDVPIDVTWRNMLPPYNFPNGPGAHLLPVDPNIHIAHPIAGGVPTVAHLHGGHTESASDGLPEAWFTQGFAEIGPHFVKKRYHYDNDQEAATLWYHDHALGITRLNVYAGLAGFYLLRDQNEKMLMKNGVLPCAQYEIEMVIQDRMFTDDGELFYPSTDPEIEPGFDPLPPGPSAIAEFFGDFILVNGVAWPTLDVEPRKYRFRMLNGSDSRFYVLEFHDAQTGGTAQPFLQIGTDVGLLEKPVALETLLMGPGERCDLVVDFGGMDPGDQVFIRNFGPDDPLKGFNPDGTLSDGEGGVLPPADPATTGQIMMFNVVAPPMDQKPGNRTGREWDVSWTWCDEDPTIDETTDLRPTIDPLTQTGATRQLVLFEGLDNYGRLQPLLGTLSEGSLAWFEPITENPMVNDVEVWEVYNATEDAHPIHLHLVAFQIINRESFEGEVEEKPQPQHDGSFGVGGILTVDSLGGDATGPEPNEDGWKDTAVMLPGQVTRVIAKFDRPGRYVWHCHILSHEDHEMMRPYHVGPMPAMAALGRESSTQNLGVVGSLGRTPEIRFELPSAGDVEVKIFNVRGAVVRTLLKETREAGSHAVRWDGTDDSGNTAPSGVYFSQVVSGTLVQNKKVVLVK